MNTLAEKAMAALESARQYQRDEQARREQEREALYRENLAHHLKQALGITVELGQGEQQATIDGLTFSLDENSREYYKLLLHRDCTRCGAHNGASYGVASMQRLGELLEQSLEGKLSGICAECLEQDQQAREAQWAAQEEADSFLPPAPPAEEALMSALKRFICQYQSYPSGE